MSEQPINWRPKHLEDELVKLTPVIEADFEKLFKVASDPLIWEQHPTRDRYKREVFKLFFDSAIAGNTAFLILDKSSEQVIGSTRYYDYKSNNSSIAIGYTFLAKEYWGGRYNKSSKSLLLNYAFSFVDKVYFHIDTTNIRSQLAIMKIGATKAGTVDFDHYGEIVPYYEYLIEKKDWLK